VFFAQLLSGIREDRFDLRLLIPSQVQTGQVQPVGESATIQPERFAAAAWFFGAEGAGAVV